MIHPRFQRLFLALGRALRKPPVNLARGLRSLPAVGSLPSPWETRALASLLEYRRAAISIWELVAEHGLLNVGPHTPAEGIVPGAPQMYYNTNKYRCELVDQTTGIYYYVQAWQSGPYLKWDTFTAHVIAHEQQPNCPAAFVSFRETDPSLNYHLASDYPGTTPEEVLDRDMPEEGMVQFAARDLEDAGVVDATWAQPFPYEGLLIADEVLAVGEALGSVYSDAGTADPRDRLWRMACVGDWIGADAAALELGSPAIARLTQDRDALCREERLDRIHDQINKDGLLTPRSLLALDDLGPEHSAAHLAKALSPGHRAARTAMRIVARRGDPAWLEPVRKLRLRLGFIPESRVDAKLVQACEAFIAKASVTATHSSGASGIWSRAGRGVELQ